MGGATSVFLVILRVPLGLSPRGRGNRAKRPSRVGGGGSIPAWAGQPRSSTDSGIGFGVYPRVGGATSDVRHTNLDLTGLSPRGRGNPLTGVPHRIARGSIPAWAGQPSVVLPADMPGSVYPRVGGATYAYTVLADLAAGLSPRGRGNPVCRVSPGLVSGSIPAWAGQPSSVPRFRLQWPVYPRVGGATPISRISAGSNYLFR